jgi:selenocysteine-specific elongation factor
VLEARQREAPWALGLPSFGLAKRLDIAEPTLLAALSAFIADGRLVQREGYYATPDFHAALTMEQQAFFERIFSGAAERPGLPVPYSVLCVEMRAAKILGLEQALDMLMASGALVRVAADMYLAAQIRVAREALETLLRTDGSITPARFRDALGSSRKHIIPLLEWFDAGGLTLRRGDTRTAPGPCNATPPKMG